MDLTRPSELKPLLERHGLYLSKRFGQNFLVDRTHLMRVVDAAQVGPDDDVFEVGPGVGTLTVELAQRARRVVSVELDRKLPPVLSEVLAPYSNASVVQGDALALDLPAFLAERFPDAQRVKVVANIPYNITSPLLIQFLGHKRLFASITLMVQKEVANRLRAKAGGDDYGSLSVFAQYHAEVSVAAVVPRGAFFPPPKVDSAVVHLVPRPVPPVEAPGESAFFAVSRAAFGQRRKTLSNALSGAAGDALPFSREQINAALASAGIDGQRRGETLTLAEIAAIASALPWGEAVAVAPAAANPV